MRKYALIINSENEVWCNMILRFEAMNMIEAQLMAEAAIEKEKEDHIKENDRKFIIMENSLKQLGEPCRTILKDFENLNERT